MGSEEEDYASERRGFWDEVDLHLGAIVQTNARKREKEREKERQSKTHQQHNIEEYKR